VQSLLLLLLTKKSKAIKHYPRESASFLLSLFCSEMRVQVKLVKLLFACVGNGKCWGEDMKLDCIAMCASLTLILTYVVCFRLHELSKEKRQLTKLHHTLLVANH